MSIPPSPSLPGLAGYAQDDVAFDSSRRWEREGGGGDAAYTYIHPIKYISLYIYNDHPLIFLCSYRKTKPNNFIVDSSISSKLFSLYRFIKRDCPLIKCYQNCAWKYFGNDLE
jgi:hypothetical protein